MSEKIALVDIDGCLVQDKKLNLALVERLKEYDEIIFFTQRSKFIQVAQVSRAYLMDEVAKDEIITTADAVKALQKVLDKPIRVSTSVDPYFGEPTKYYEEQLRDFEIGLQTKAISERENLSLGPFTKEVKEETDHIRNQLKVGLEVPPERVYPKDKMMQFKHLATALVNKNKNSGGCEIDYFDDNKDNQKEILAIPDLPIIPRCIVVNKQYFLPLDLDNVPAEKKAVADDFVNYMKARQDERRLSGGKEYHSLWARILKKEANATTKLSAAEKCITSLTGKPVKMTNDELVVLTDARLGGVFAKNSRYFPGIQAQINDYVLRNRPRA